MSDLWQLGIVFVLVLVNAVLAGSELALVSLRESQLLRLEERGGSGRALARLARDPNRFLATIQIGITLSGFFASATAAVSLAGLVSPSLEFLGDAANPVAIVLVTLALAFVTLVIGELAPKRIAMQHAEGWALVVARPLDWMAILFRPVVWTLSASTNVVVALAGADPARGREEVTEEELRDIVASQPTLSLDERQVIEGALEVGDRILRQVMVSRTRVFALRADMDAAEAVEALVSEARSRAPVYREGSDNYDGALHLRDLIHASGPVGRLARPVPSYPESAPVLSTLRGMQGARESLAFVTDEHGSIVGIVTIEDLVEEIVGEIYDEYDRDVAAVQRHPDGALTLVGSFPSHDLIDLGIVVPEGRYATLAGFILDRLGHIPEVGAAVELDGWRLTVTAMNERAIAQVRAVRRTPAEAGHAGLVDEPRPSA